MEAIMNEQNLSLTAREQDVLTLLHQGKRNREIAQALAISEVRVEQHLSSIYRKFGVNSRLEAVLHTTGTVRTPS
jgi:DNA-binding NarL/FixJ family response regulator